MYKDKKILAIIPARGGSKGLPKKNIKLLNEKPLIGWTIEQALASEYIDHVYVSTDDFEIAEIAKSFGAKVPSLRPSSLATDETSSAALVTYILQSFAEENITFDYFILLEPTSPLRKEKDIDNALKLAIDNPNYSGVVSLGEVHMEHPQIVKKISNKGIITPFINESKKITQRQQLDQAYFPYGVLYIVKTTDFTTNQQFYGEKSLPYFIERWQCYEVDDIFDFLAIESIIKYIKL